MEGIPHYLIDIKNPDESFSAAEFQELGREKISDITNRGKLPMIVGGTGLYIQSVFLIINFQRHHQTLVFVKLGNAGRKRWKYCSS